jgi:hypothetical protein
VVDIDGEEGAVAWKEIAGADFIPDTWVAKTGRGLHLWLHDGLNVWPTTKLAEKLDFKGLGGYVAAPPSIHPSGHSYEWLQSPSEANVMEMPEGLKDILNAGKFARDRVKAKRVERQNFKETGLISNTPSFSGIIDRMRAALPGERNNVLNWAAYTMIQDGATDDDLQVLASVAREVRMPDYEIVRTINSAQAGSRD